MDSVVTFGEGTVNIIHFGGSHIQADIWSGQLRENFQFVDAGMKGARGLVFPFDIAQTNNPPNYNTTYKGVWRRKRSATRKDKGDWGLTGMQVSTEDTNASFTIHAKTRHYHQYDFKSVKIFCTLDSASLQLTLPPVDSEAVISYHPKEGYMKIDFARQKDTLTLFVDKTDSLQRRFILYGIQFENEDPGVVYHAMGVNGADVKAYLRCTLIADQLPAVKPDLLIFSVGINDAYTTKFRAEEYKQRYDSLINIMRAVYPDVPILFTTNNDSYYKRKYPNQNAYDVTRVMKELSKAYNCAIWDMFEVMGGLGSIDKWVQLDMAKSDKIHFKGNGYRLIGDLMFAAMMKDYQQFLSTKK